MEEDPNVMWTHTRFNPAIHPNGNVLMRKNNDVLELNGLTGVLIRTIPITVTGDNSDIIEISQDGSRFIAQGCLVDYESGEILKVNVCPCFWQFTSFLHPYNYKIIYAKNSYAFVVYDLNENSETEYIVSDNNKFSTAAFAVSKDGRFIALARRDFEDEYNTYIDLFDAKTMKPIRQLEKTVADGRQINYIRFSENAKYVGYGQKVVGTAKATFFECEPPYKKWELNNEIESEYGYHSLEFINDDSVYLFYYLSQDHLNSSYIIYDIKNEKKIYSTNKYFSLYPKFNKTYKSLLLSWEVTTAIDLNKLLSGVSVTDNKHFDVLNSEYKNGFLNINYDFKSPQLNLQILDLQGNSILTKIVPAQNQFMIQLNIPVGIYIVQLTDGKLEYSQKFIVTE
jgi:hypothetical protein